MSNVIRFRSPPRAELNGGVISRGPDTGKQWYFIDYVDEEGGRLGVWDGPSYDMACEALAEWRQDGVRTVDLLREAL
ncbi:hypothetical protein [Ancylobacter sp. TS-1]|uniref:hypothetical protein n=1 Tax=Ancylobacter sp. TS-1 TaxID=1850374 RepID=UPI001265BD9C|nr:hypothetical protein [Ancylobacter sp. TS-1]QFR34706.1 hypothetical protein GBB76_17240 [Ancylobacter sp. TS-1]